LSRIAAAIFIQGIQVHNARVATFGERVEDTFLVSDPEHQPLTNEARDRLVEALTEQIEESW
jgi:[protein-PII] uridylyltransferase